MTLEEAIISHEDDNDSGADKENNDGDDVDFNADRKKEIDNEASEKNDDHDVNDDADDDELGWQGELPVGRGDAGVPLPAGLHHLQGRVQLYAA
jgi:hypothetical protein